MLFSVITEQLNNKCFNIYAINGDRRLILFFFQYVFLIEADVMFGYPPLSVTAHALWPKVCVLSCSLYTILKNLFSSPPSACLKRKLTLYLEKIYSIRVLYYLVGKATTGP